MKRGRLVLSSAPHVLRLNSVRFGSVDWHFCDVSGLLESVCVSGGDCLVFGVRVWISETVSGLVMM